MIEEYVRACVRVYESDCDSDLPIKVMQERNGVMGQKERKRGKERHMEKREKEMRPEKPLNRKSISRKRGREMDRK